MRPKGTASSILPVAVRRATAPPPFFSPQARLRQSATQSNAHSPREISVEARDCPDRRPPIVPERAAMPFVPEELPPGLPPLFEDVTAAPTGLWIPVYRHDCAFGPDPFVERMMNLVRNPNLNSSWLFRADIVYDDAQLSGAATAAPPVPPRPRDVRGMPRLRTLVRKLIPRNERRDQPLDQTCTFHRSLPDASSISSLVIYLPHVFSCADLPFYHPKTRAIAHLHEWDPTQNQGSISVHVSPFQLHHELCPKLRRTAYHMLEILHKHGQSSLAGYVKRVHHDRLVPQPRFQNRYACLKSKYARSLVDSWAESTDPGKHVFEDLGIAAFLIELWADMYPDGRFPGFVDIGCGNGLLVFILTQEGYPGWGFDVRARKSWAHYRKESSAITPSACFLEQRLLVPKVVLEKESSADSHELDPDHVHDGVFPAGTFIISNHADELTPWTPILGAMSHCPFIMIPCCSHNLTGDKYRAPPSRDKSKPSSTYASLVDWVTQVAEDCGWRVETEMLRIPSTRNTCLVGRERTRNAAIAEADLDAVLCKYGGIDGYRANAARLLRTAPRGH